MAIGGLSALPMHCSQMPIISLLCAYPSVNDPAHLSRRAEEALDGLALAERESSNYVEGRYFSGRYRQVSIELALSDTIEHDDLPYWIAIASYEMSEDKLAAFADTLVREKLLPHGFKVARFINFGRFDEQRLDY
jgi:hypothetical protein